MSNIKRLAIISMLLAMAIVLNILESFIPVFIPGVKLGLANTIILIMLYEFKPQEALAVNLARIVLVGIMRSNIFTPTFLMSLSGGICSFLAMYLFSRIKLFSSLGVSVIGSVCHCVGQILMAIIILETSAVILYLPWILILSILTGTFSGILVRTYLKRSIANKFLNN